MNMLSIILTVLLIGVASASAVMDFQGPAQITELMARLEYRPGFERTLGLIKGLGALGLLIGFFMPWLGVLAGLSFVAYFVLAVGAHRKLQDAPKEMAPALGLAVLSALVVITTVLA